MFVNFMKDLPQMVLIQSYCAAAAGSSQSTTMNAGWVKWFVGR